MADRDELIARAVQELQGKTPTPRLDVEVLLSFVLKTDRTGIYTKTITKSSLAKFEALLKKRSQAVPIAHLTHSAWFWGMEFYVDENVLIPRPETETLVELAIAEAGTIRKPVIVDVGTGSGCIAISLKRTLPRAKVTGLDKSKEALRVARKNAKRLGHAVVFKHSNLLDAYISNIDLVVANLPYLEPTEYTGALRHEPKLALVSKNNKLYHQLLDYPHYTKGIFEMHPDQAKALAKEAELKGFQSEIISGYGVSYLKVWRQS